MYFRQKMFKIQIVIAIVIHVFQMRLNRIFTKIKVRIFKKGYVCTFSTINDLIKYQSSTTQTTLPYLMLM